MFAEIAKVKFRSVKIKVPTMKIVVRSVIPTITRKKDSGMESKGMSAKTVEGIGRCQRLMRLSKILFLLGIQK